MLKPRYLEENAYISLYPYVPPSPLFKKAYNMALFGVSCWGHNVMCSDGLILLTLWPAGRMAGWPDGWMDGIMV